MVRVWRKIFKIFPWPQKAHALVNQVQILFCGEKEITDKYKINQELECFYKNLFTKNSESQKEDIEDIFVKKIFPFLRKKSLRLVKIL